METLKRSEIYAYILNYRMMGEFASVEYLEKIVRQQGRKYKYSVDTSKLHGW